VHRSTDTPATGTRLPTLVVDGWGPGQSELSPHVVPAPGARWTLLLTHAERPAADEHRARLAAESVTAVVVAPQGVVQHVADDVEDALEVVAAFRLGLADPVLAAEVAPLRTRCAAEGRRRRAAVHTARRRAA
jgi:hypothetical protein